MGTAWPYYLKGMPTLEGWEAVAPFGGFGPRPNQAVDFLTERVREGAELARDLVSAAADPDTADPHWLAAASFIAWHGESRVLSDREWLRVFAAIGSYVEDGHIATRPTRTRTLYRGATTKRKRGMGWTPELDLAARYALHHALGGDVPHIWAASVGPDRVLCAFTGNLRRAFNLAPRSRARSRIDQLMRAEIVLDPTGLRIEEYDGPPLAQLIIARARRREARAALSRQLAWLR